MSTMTEDKIEISMKIDEPTEYRLVMWNDDTTPLEVVVVALRLIGLSSEKAIEHTFIAHKTGRTEIGTYSLEVANTLKNSCEQFVHNQGFEEFRMSVEEV